jgi:DNA topoisomerase VI subunit A
VAPIAYRSAPVKDPQADDFSVHEAPESAFLEELPLSGRLAPCPPKPSKIGVGNRKQKAKDPLHFHQIQRPDWSPYTSPNTLPQKAGVPKDLILRAALKELVDNAADETDRVGRPGQIEVTEHGSHNFTVTDWGDGLSDIPRDIAGLFSLDRAMLSSKLWRLPTRGAQGLGIKIPVGAVASGNGSIVVCTRNQHITLRPRIEDGRTEIVSKAPINFPIGCKINVQFDEAYPHDPDATLWAEITINLARHGLPPFRGRPCIHWFDADHFALLLRSVPREMTLREFLSHFDGCNSDALRAKIVQQFGKGRLCLSFNRDEATKLLELLQAGTKPFKPERLCPLGLDVWPDLSDGYACKKGRFREGARPPYAHIQVLVECWVSANGFAAEGILELTALSINRSVSIIQPRLIRKKGRDVIFYAHPCLINLSLARENFSIALNITAPLIRTLSDGKAPDLRVFSDLIKQAIETAVGRAQRRRQSCSSQRGKRITQIDAVLEVLPKAIERAKIGADGKLYSFGQRNLFYRVRELVKIVLPELDLKYKHFTDIITDYENKHGEIEMMTRDPRGIYVAPHGGAAVGLGTKSVALYQRPPWSYSNILFIEKEDLIETLRQAGFFDRWDCFAISSKGFSTRGSKDLIDKIANSRKDEPTEFFCVHDADAAGTLIAQTLAGATKARAARSIRVIDLGFFPWTAVTEGLERERADKTEYRRPVADYVKERDRDNSLSGNPGDEPNWEEWLQNWRIELNTKRPEEFVQWMDQAFDRHSAKKVRLPLELFTETLEEQLKERIDGQLREIVLRDTQGWRNQQSASQLDAILVPDEHEVQEASDLHFQQNPAAFWTDVVTDFVNALTPPAPDKSPYAQNPS